MFTSHDEPDRLIPGEPEAFVVSAHHVAGYGWECKISVRRQFQLWGHASTAVYERLVTEELIDVVLIALQLELLSGRGSTGGGAGAA